ncbi:Stress response protein SCP2 [Abditibacterium utsteinense]|uniref:Stress response protein SCP2 n=1 Tax=Abditibacterium utsteinense TaxID=1960156 RepID=A0A2S8SQ75_9BACT|nr:TerD family protein [Abditibacterium utsteinense]PQV62945.1 Stress response protein SCP2 [Abditibacterium utsteinense]
MITLARGQKIKLSEVTSSLQLRAQIAAQGAGLSFDFSCFGLDENGKLSDDRYFVFYNQKASPEGALKLQSDGIFTLDLARLPKSIQKLVFVATIDGNGTMANLSRGALSFFVESKEIARFEFQGRDFGTEKAIMVAEIYLKDVWRLAAVGQGFAEGLGAILKRFGGREIEETPVSPVVSSSAQNPMVPARTSPAPPVRVAPPSAPPTPRSSNQAENCCIRCGKNEGFLGQWLGINGLDRSTRRCQSCESEIKVAFARLRGDFEQAWQSGVLSTSLWGALWTRFESARSGTSRTQALEFLRPDALRFMERLVTMAASDGVITPAEESYVRQICTFLELPTETQSPFLSRLEHVKKTAAIREGHLPRVEPGDNHLDAGEICHLYLAATYHKVNARPTSQISGRLMATSKKLVFLSPVGGTVIQWKNIMTARATSDTLYLDLATRSGHGAYQVSDPQWCEAVVTALTRMAKRQLLSPQSDNPTRHISQDVKNAVWQRDGGRCVQCRANTYLEFDHEIPFSRGGANTLDNVQLLCRKCNGEKGDRI